jgi:lipopolysaccharide cholinephosphotransferase
MINLSTEVLEARKIQLLLLQELLKVCNEHNLKIFAAYGTLLGAIRHKGFIPWDDDIDMDMLRPDYDKLVSIAPKAFQPPLFFQEAQGSSFLRSLFPLRAWRCRPAASI